MKNIETFFRYEFKYFISDKLSNIILNDSVDFMKIDKYAANNLDKGYFVRSLYFGIKIMIIFLKKLMVSKQERNLD